MCLWCTCETWRGEEYAEQLHVRAGALGHKRVSSLRASVCLALAKEKFG